MRRLLSARRRPSMAPRCSWSGTSAGTPGEPFHWLAGEYCRQLGNFWQHFTTLFGEQFVPPIEVSRGRELREKRVRRP